MAENHDKLITNLALIGAGYFFVVKPILEKIGITKSDDDRAGDTASNSNGWDPTFYKTFISKNSNTSWQLRKQADLEKIARQIKGAFGILNDNEKVIYDAFRYVRSLLELSQLAEKYSQLYKRDLLGELKSPWYYLHDGLDVSEFNYLASILNKLPVAIKA